MLATSFFKTGPSFVANLWQPEYRKDAPCVNRVQKFDQSHRRARRRFAPLLHPQDQELRAVAATSDVQPGTVTDDNLSPRVQSLVLDLPIRSVP